MPGSKRKSPEINASSMADIAFLLLVFFLVTTTIASDKGLPIVLPPERPPDQKEVEVHDHNVLKVLINSSDQLLVEEKDFKVDNLKDEVYKHLTNRGKLDNYSDSPKDAVVSIKADRGTSYDVYLTVMDHIYAGYNQARAEAINVTVPQYLEMKSMVEEDPAIDKKLDKAQEAYPLRISEAEPSDIGS